MVFGLMVLDPDLLSLKRLENVLHKVYKALLKFARDKSSKSKYIAFTRFKLSLFAIQHGFQLIYIYSHFI